MRKDSRPTSNHISLDPAPVPLRLYHHGPLDRGPTQRWSAPWRCRQRGRLAGFVGRHGSQQQPQQPPQRRLRPWPPHGPGVDAAASWDGFWGRCLLPALSAVACVVFLAFFVSPSLNAAVALVFVLGGGSRGAKPPALTTTSRLGQSWSIVGCNLLHCIATGQDSFCKLVFARGPRGCLTDTHTVTRRIAERSPHRCDIQRLYRRHDKTIRRL
jgi:hypothetical protein